jgi:hypothetical protein
MPRNSWTARRKVTWVALVVVAASAYPAFSVVPGARAAAPEPDVTLAAEPAALSTTGLPCLPVDFTVTMTNNTSEPVFADTSITAQRPVALSRDVFTSYLPAADPAQPVSAVVDVTVPRDTAPGTYDILLRSGRRSVTVPVEVTAIPQRGPGDNLAYGERATASSTHGRFDPCGAVDGDSAWQNWSTSTGWNDGTSRVFPDWLAVEWPTPEQVERVVIHTYATPTSPAARQGIKDFDVQVREGGTWTTVREFRNNTAAQITATFPVRRTDGVRVVVHSSNSGDYSRILELEAYGPTT